MGFLTIVPSSLIFLQEFFLAVQYHKEEVVASSASSNEIQAVLQCNVGLHLPLTAKALFFH